MEKIIFRNRKYDSPENVMCSVCKLPHKKTDHFYWKCKFCVEFRLCDKCNRNHCNDSNHNNSNHNCAKSNIDIPVGFMMSSSSGRGSSNDDF